LSTRTRYISIRIGGIALNWEAIGAIGESVGAGAVLVTLIVLVVQIRQSIRVTAESNRLDRASAIDRHSDSIGRWRGRLIENDDLMRIWVTAENGEALDPIARMRFSMTWIDFTNTQRANFVRAETVGATGLRRQAVLSVANEANKSETMLEAWQMNRAWQELESAEFVRLVDEAREEIKAQTTPRYQSPGAVLDRETDARVEHESGITRQAPSIKSP
jgi:hypothetical protein